jgi:hypothetical protein
MAQLDSIPIMQALLAGPGDKLLEESGIGALRVLRLPSFVPEVLKEIFDESFHGSILVDYFAHGIGLLS